MAKRLASTFSYHRFVERKNLASYSPGLIFDVVGTVMFVSREIRERKGTSSSFWTSKWVHLKDGETYSQNDAIVLFQKTNHLTEVSVDLGEHSCSTV